MRLRTTQIRQLCLLAICCTAFLRSASSHDPITTTVTFNKEIVRILQQHCWSCHTLGKSKSDIPLTTFEQARPWAKAIKEEVLEKRMPPFQTVRGFGDFHNSYILPKREVEMLVSWVEGGAPRGEVKDLPTKIVAENSAQSRQPDLRLQASEVTKIPAGEGDEVRCIKLPTKLAQAQWIQALEFLPSNTNIIQSAEILLARDCTANCAGGEKIGVWNPGATLIRLPHDTGFALPANACLTMKIRYQKTAEPATDQSALGIYQATGQIGKQARQQIVKAPVTLIPAGATNQRVQAFFTVRENAEAVAIRPLLFPYVQAFEAVAKRPDGSTEVLVLAQNYRTNWQPQYFYQTPVRLPAGTRIEIAVYLNNSDENRNLHAPIKAMRFAAPLCEILLAHPLTGNQITAHNKP